MGGGGGGRFSGTQGGRRILSANNTAKRFFRGGSTKYDSFNAKQLAIGNMLLKMEKPGNVPGSRTVYYKEVDVHGNTVRVYKTTYGPDGRIIHIKEKYIMDMETTRSLLNSFRDLKITKPELQAQLESNLHSISANKPVIVTLEDVVRLLIAYKTQEISYNTLLDWVNTVWSTDLFEYATEQQDSIASVMDVLGSI